MTIRTDVLNMLRCLGDENCIYTEQCLR